MVCAAITHHLPAGVAVQCFFVYASVLRCRLVEEQTSSGVPKSKHAAAQSRCKGAFFIQKMFLKILRDAKGSKTQASTRKWTGAFK
jgi:hypothetical protein